MDYMPGPYDAASDAGDDHARVPEYEVSEHEEGPSDAVVAALAEFDGEATQRRIAAEADAEQELPKAPAGYQAGPRDTPQSMSSARDVGLPVTSIEAGRPGDDSGPLDGVIAESLHETLDAFKGWFAERAVEFAADAMYPGLGRVINIALTIKGVAGNVEALTSPDRPRNLHVPLLHVVGGLTMDLNVRLSGGDGSRDDAPLVSGFLTPENDGLFGGWEIEVDRPSESELKTTPLADQEAQPVPAEPVAGPSVEQAERSRSQLPAVEPVIEDDLSLVRQRVKEPGRCAVVLREAAWRLRTRLFARTAFAAEFLLVIYDPLTGLGMWLVNPDLPGDLAGRRIMLWLDPATGMTIVSID